eukprot:gene16619-22866_t
MVSTSLIDCESLEAGCQAILDQIPLTDARAARFIEEYPPTRLFELIGSELLNDTQVVTVSNALSKVFGTAVGVPVLVHADTSLMEATFHAAHPELRRLAVTQFSQLVVMKEEVFRQHGLTANVEDVQRFVLLQLLIAVQQYHVTAAQKYHVTAVQQYHDPDTGVANTALRSLVSCSKHMPNVAHTSFILAITCPLPLIPPQDPDTGVANAAVRSLDPDTGVANMADPGTGIANTAVQSLDPDTGVANTAVRSLVSCSKHIPNAAQAWSPNGEGEVCAQVSALVSHKDSAVRLRVMGLLLEVAGSSDNIREGGQVSALVSHTDSAVRLRVMGLLLEVAGSSDNIREGGLIDPLLRELSDTSDSLSCLATLGLLRDLLEGMQGRTAHTMSSGGDTNGAGTGLMTASNVDQLCSACSLCSPVLPLFSSAPSVLQCSLCSPVLPLFSSAPSVLQCSLCSPVLPLFSSAPSVLQCSLCSPVLPLLLPMLQGPMLFTGAMLAAVALVHRAMCSQVGLETMSESVRCNAATLFGAIKGALSDHGDASVQDEADVLDAVGQLCQNHLAAQMLAEDKDLTLAIASKAVGSSPAAVLLSLLQQPFAELRIAVYRFLTALCFRTWFAAEACRCSPLIDHLLKRSGPASLLPDLPTAATSNITQWHYACLTASLKLSANDADYIHTRTLQTIAEELHEMVRAGPFGSKLVFTAEPQVATAQL